MNTTRNPDIRRMNGKLQMLRPKNPRRFYSKKKAMLTVFMDYNGIVHYEFLPEDQTVNKEYYLGVIRRLRLAKQFQKRKNM